MWSPKTWLRSHFERKRAKHIKLVTLQLRYPASIILQRPLITLANSSLLQYHHVTSIVSLHSIPGDVKWLGDTVTDHLSGNFFNITAYHVEPSRSWKWASKRWTGYATRRRATDSTGTEYVTTESKSDCEYAFPFNARVLFFICACRVPCGFYTMFDWTF